MRVPAKPLRSYPFYLQPFFWNQRRKYGEAYRPRYCGLERRNCSLPWRYSMA